MGSSFRFDDLKAFIYRLEVHNRLSIPNIFRHWHVYQEKEAAGRDPVHPKSFHLAVNYRSHAGVVNCAHSVVELITQFWPHSIDVLPRERGLVPGPPPMLFVGWDTEGSFTPSNTKSFLIIRFRCQLWAILLPWVVSIYITKWDGCSPKAHAVWI